MVKSVLLLVFLIFVITTTCDGIARNINKKSRNNGTSDVNTRSIIAGAVVSAISKKMASSVVEYYMSKVQSGLSIAILNRMQDRFLVNPKLYLSHGKTISPPALIIPPPAKDQCQPKDECLAKTLFIEKKPDGVLCYEFATSAETSTKSLCIFFFLSDKDNQYGITIPEYIINEPPKIESGSLISARTRGMNYIFKPPTLPITIIAQMTTSENAQLFLEIRENFQAVQTSVSKRELFSTLALGLLSGAVSALTTSAIKYLATERGTILTLENLSTDLDLFTLYDPRWYQDDDVRVQNIIPWKLEPGKSYDITLTTKKTFSVSPVFVLSFAVHEEGFYQRRLVLAIWWPSRKNFQATHYGWYSISWLRTKQANVLGDLNKLAAAIRNHPANPIKANNELKSYTIFETFGGPYQSANNRVNYVAVYKLLRYKFWKFPILSEGTTVKGLKVLTAMGNGEKNGMVMKMFGSSWQSTEGESIPTPVDYVNSAEHNPPM